MPPRVTIHVHHWISILATWWLARQLQPLLRMGMSSCFSCAYWAAFFLISEQTKLRWFWIEFQCYGFFFVGSPFSLSFSMGLSYWMEYKLERTFHNNEALNCTRFLKFGFSRTETSHPSSALMLTNATKENSRLDFLTSFILVPHRFWIIGFNEHALVIHTRNTL